MANPYSPLKAYVAARWDDREDALFIKDCIEKAGIICTSTWLTPHDNQSMDALKAKTDVVSVARQKAIKDFEDIDESDILVLYSPKKAHRNGTGGKHVETGYALATGVPVFILGERENIFHYHPLVQVVDGVADLLATLGLKDPNEGS